MSSPTADIIRAVNNDWALQLSPALTEEELETGLAVYLNELIVHDFSRLLGLLYRIDVSEMKLRQMLKDYPRAEAGRIIAHLVVERQKQKIKSREEWGRREKDIPEDERW